MYINNKKLKSKFKYADKLKIPYVAIIGEDEIKNDKVSLKNLSTGEQNIGTVVEIVEILKKFKKMI